MRLFGKKASLELSIQTIIIVVLAMTLLGLGLGFIRNMFGGIGGISEDVTEQVRQKILDDLITGDKKISFPKTQISIDKGGSDILTVGIRNKLDSTLNYRMRFSAVSGPSGNLAPNALDEWFQYGREVYKLPPADSEVRNIRLSVPTSLVTTSGSYFLTFDVINEQNAEIYAQKDFFIVVRG